MRAKGLFTIIGAMWTPGFDESADDVETQWSQWVSTLPEDTRLFLTDPASDREAVYRDFVARGASYGAVLLELLALEDAA